MKNALTIFVFTLIVTLFYNYVGQLVPQKEVHPPKNAEIRADMSVDEMVEAGRILVEGKGTCLTCHNGSQRFPVLDGIGARAASQKEGMDDVQYLAEALYDPNGFIVEPFAPGMPAVNKPPIGLNDQEILTVIAYLQTMGGTPSVDMNTKLKYQGAAAAPATAAPSSEDTAGGDTDITPQEMTAKYGCMACHSFDSPARMLGPSLQDIGTRLNAAQLYEALVDPDKTVAPGFPPGIMSGTLNANGFADKISQKQLKSLVDHLLTLKGPAEGATAE